MIDPRSQRIGVALGLFLSLALIVPLALPITSGRVFQGDDLGRFHLPVRAFFARCLAEGDSPLWHPGLYCGFYVHGEGQAGMDHPLHRLLYGTLPLGVAFGVEMVIGYPIAFAGMVLWLRRLGVRGGGATFGAMTFTFSSFMILRYVHMNAIEILAHLPWMLLAVEAMRGTRESSFWPNGVPLVLLDPCSSGPESPHSPVGAKSCSPGREPWVTDDRKEPEPQRGDNRAHQCRPYGAVLPLTSINPGLTPWATRFRPYGAIQVCTTSLIRSWTLRRNDNRSNPWPAFGLAMLTASQGLLGYPQYLGLSLIVAGSYAIVRLGRSPRAVLGFAIAVGLGLVMAGAQVVPQLDALAASSRARPSLEFLGMNSLQPLNLLQMITPFAFRQGWYNPGGPPTWPRHESAAYLGAVAPAACAYVWSRRRHLGKLRPVATWAACIGGIAIVLSLGRFSPLFPIWACLPVASLFRGPARFMVVAQLAASVLSGVAFSDLAGQVDRVPLRALMWPIAASLAAGIGLTMAVSIEPRGFRAEQVAGVRAMIGSTLLIAAPCALIVLAARGRRMALAALMVVAAVDSWNFALGPILQHDRPVIAKGLDPTRTASDSGRLVAPLNEGLAESSRLVGGYVALTPRRRLDYDRPETLRVAGAAWRLGSSGLRERLPIEPLPRARLVSRALESRHPAADLAIIDPESTAIVDEPIDLPGGPAGEATILLDRPGRITVRAESIGRRLLIVSESYHEGWRAAIDGRVAAVARVNGDFLGCVVEPGRHQVALVFDPASARVGRWASGCGLVVCLAMLSAGLIRNRSDGLHGGSDASRHLTHPTSRKSP